MSRWVCFRPFGDGMVAAYATRAQAPSHANHGWLISQPGTLWSVGGDAAQARDMVEQLIEAERENARLREEARQTVSKVPSTLALILFVALWVAGIIILAVMIVDAIMSLF